MNRIGGLPEILTIKLGTKHFYHGCSIPKPSQAFYYRCALHYHQRALHDHGLIPMAAGQYVSKTVIFDTNGVSPFRTGWPVEAQGFGCQSSPSGPGGSGGRALRTEAPLFRTSDLPASWCG